MSIFDWLLIAAVVIGLYFAIRYMIKNRGGCSCSGSSCMGNCSSCSSGCGSSKKKK